MGHTVQVHNAAYAQWSSESMLEDSMKRCIRDRDLTSSQESTVAESLRK